MSTERLLLNAVPPLYSVLHLLVFCSTLFVYNVHYLIKKSTPELSDRFGWSQHHRLWHYLLMSIGIAGCCIAAFHLPQNILLVCMLLAVLSFSYSIPLLPFKNKKRLKDFGWIKILVLTTVWTIVTSVLPILYHSQAITDYPFEIMIRFVFMFTLCVAFDIRDMQTDMEAGIATLPNIIGIRGSYRVMSVSMVLFIIMSIIQYARYPSVNRLIAEIIVAIATKLAIDYARKHPSDRAYLGLVDGMMLLYATLVLWQ
jgi:4-hydroxybenzoate polyprenyltransferase